MLLSKKTKAFCKQTNYMLGRNNRHDILINNNNSFEYISDKTSCNKFCEYFASVFTSNNNNIANFLLRYHLKSTIDDICFNSNDILKIIHGMNDTMSHGPYNFSMILKLKNSCFISTTAIFIISVFVIWR